MFIGSIPRLVAFNRTRERESHAESDSERVTEGGSEEAREGREEGRRKREREADRLYRIFPAPEPGNSIAQFRTLFSFAWS